MDKVKLGSVMTLHRGYDLPNSQRKPGDIPVISSSGISGSHSAAKLDGENVVTGRYGTIGEVFYYDGPCWPLNTTLYVEDFHGNDPKYVAYLLEVMLDALKIDGADKSTVPGVDRNVLHDLTVPYISDLVCQKSTTQVLTAIDDKIANNNKLILELEETAQLVFDYWFTQFDFPDGNGQPYHSSGGKMVWNDVLKREIPEGWSAGSIASLGEIISGATPSTSDATNYAETGIAWITPNDLSDSNGRMHIGHGERDISEKGLRSCSAQRMPIGSVIMSSRAPIGYLAVATRQCCTNQGCKSLIPDVGYGTYFVYLTMKRRMPIIKAQGVGTTFTEVSKETLSAIPLELPPVSIASRFEELVLPLCNQIKALEAQCDELSSLRDWLLPMLMNGQATITG